MGAGLDFEKARFNMVEQQVRPWDVLDQTVLDLLFVVRREAFVPEPYRALAFTDVDRFVMSSVLPMAAISLFHVASRVDALLKRFLALPVLAAQPEITRVYEEGRWTDIASRITLFTKGMVVAALFCTALFAVIGRDIIVLLSGGAYAAAYRVFLVLLPTVPVAAVVLPGAVVVAPLPDPGTPPLPEQAAASRARAVSATIRRSDPGEGTGRG